MANRRGDATKRQDAIAIVYYSGVTYRYDVLILLRMKRAKRYRIYDKRNFWNSREVREWIAAHQIATVIKILTAEKGEK